MHKYLENYVLGKGYEDMTEMGQLAKSMAQKVIDTGLAPVDGYFGSEVTLYYPGLYAGSTDLVGLHNGQESIIDFKQSNRPKRVDWIEDYFMQIAAYAMAHDYVHGSNIQQGVIMICTPDLYYQEFKVEGLQLRSWKHKFLKKLDEYFELKNDSKEQADVNVVDLLKEFEKDTNKA
jgi:genome maintenance exonuclease 1